MTVSDLKRDPNAKHRIIAIAFMSSIIEIHKGHQNVSVVFVLCFVAKFQFKLSHSKSTIEKNVYSSSIRWQSIISLRQQYCLKSLPLVFFITYFRKVFFHKT